VPAKAHIASKPAALGIPCPLTGGCFPCPLTGGCPVVPNVGIPPPTTPVCTPEIPRTLRRGARGPLVRLLQAMLIKKGFDPGGVDGVFGRRTRAALLAFQTAHGLTPDGVAGPATWFALLC
jgi:peptidoglycan hydrolase-like protein with peptidoglycan-binding domain